MSTRTAAEAPPLWLYGITSGPDADAAVHLARSVDDSVRAVVAGELAGIVGRGIAGDVRDRLVAHFDVLSAVASGVDILPVRFGVVADDDERTRDVLRTRAKAIDATLARVRGHVEMRVRAEYRRDEVLREITLARPDVLHLREATRTRATTAERLRLGRMVVGALEERRAVEAPRLLRALSALASDVRSSATAVQTEMLRASFLVARGDVDRFRDAAESARVGEVPLIVRVTGPAAPWSFVGVEGAAPARRRGA